ncbi:hypothetical protein [Rosistilla oblonga]|uniref:hypothetical protein n=1 Tax=Rosistilla oblonga TaxID=2527990 RepID=UPI003A985D4C
MITYFRWRASRENRTLDRRYVCVSAILAGPMFGTLYFLADAYLISEHEFVHPDDYWGDLIALATLGTAAGLAASAVLWVGLSRTAR